MHPTQYFSRKKIYTLGQWAFCGGLCILLGACSTLGLGSHKKAKADRSSKFAILAETDQEVETIQASYRPPSPGNTIYDLPDAQDYLINENRQWVDKLDTAPEWKRTPEELNPPLFQEHTPPPAAQEPDVPDEEIAEPLQPAAPLESGRSYD